MQLFDNILQLVGISHTALLSVVFGMMLVSLPLGVFVVFNTNVGDDINFEYPLNNLDFLKKTGYSIPFDIEIGDVFIVFWATYAVLFTIALLGPKKGFLQSLSTILSHGKLETKSNYMLTITKWFSILILVSMVIDFIQNGFGLATIPPAVQNNLIHFLFVSMAPIVEELIFRVILIGFPIFVFYSSSYSISYFFKSLWTPNLNLNISSSKKSIFLIMLVSIFFGLAHIIAGDPWSEGKFAQATISGIILGWLYLRFGLICAILVHWGTNYFIFSYANFVSQINTITVDAAFLHPLLNSLEVIFFISGIFSISIFLVHYFNSKKAHKLNIE